MSVTEHSEAGTVSPVLWLQFKMSPFKMNPCSEGGDGVWGGCGAFRKIGLAKSEFSRIGPVKATLPPLLPPAGCYFISFLLIDFPC